jgi:hypothetical protein
MKKERQITYNVILGSVRATIGVVEKQPVRVFVALRTQHAMRMRHIVMCGLPRSAILFSHFLLKTPFSKKQVTEH